MSIYEDSLQDSKGVNAETDSDGIPLNKSPLKGYSCLFCGGRNADGNIWDYRDLKHYPGCAALKENEIDKQDANVGSLLDQLKMHNEELRELSAEVGRSLTVLEAHTYRIRRLKEQLITKMLEEENE